MRNATQSQLEDVIRIAAARLSEQSMRLTLPRLHILKVLYAQRRPSTVVELGRTLDGPHRTTLYRTMENLESIGLVKRVRFLHEDQERFELGEELRPHHHHVVCESCGTVAAVQAEPSRPKLPRGFRLFGHQLEFYGLCAACNRGVN